MSGETNVGETKDTFKSIRGNSLKPTAKLSSGCPSIDKILNGGLPTYGITEIFGESGSGKTQMCLQLCITCQYPEKSGGLSSGVAYISTEAPFPQSRLNQLVQERQNFSLHDNIFISNLVAKDYSLMIYFLNNELKQLLKERNVKLVIIDSIAGIFRGAESVGSQRADEIRRFSRILHSINRNFSACVVVVNQATQTLGNCGDLVPALGLAWSNMVTTRLQLHRRDKTTRMFSVIFSPNNQPHSTTFSIENRGICCNTN